MLRKTPLCSSVIVMVFLCSCNIASKGLLALICLLFPTTRGELCLLYSITMAIWSVFRLCRARVEEVWGEVNVKFVSDIVLICSPKMTFYFYWECWLFVREYKFKRHGVILVIQWAKMHSRGFESNLWPLSHVIPSLFCVTLHCILSNKAKIP